MNWAKKLTAGDCPRCGGKLEDLGDGQASCDTCEYPEPESNDENVCAQCGDAIDEGSMVVCPECGAHLCSGECLADHTEFEHGKICCDDCGELFDESEVEGADVTVDGRTYHFCSRGCAISWLTRLS